MTEQMEAFAAELNVALARIVQLESLYETAGEAMKITGRSVFWNAGAECFSIKSARTEISAESLEDALNMIVTLGE